MFRNRRPPGRNYLVQGVLVAIVVAAAAGAPAGCQESRDGLNEIRNLNVPASSN